MSEVLDRLARKVKEFELKTKKLAAASGNILKIKTKKDYHTKGVSLSVIFSSFVAFITDHFNQC